MLEDLARGSRPRCALRGPASLRRTRVERWRWIPVVVAAISGWSGSGGLLVTTIISKKRSWRARISASSCCWGLRVVVGALVVLGASVVDDAGVVVEGVVVSTADPAAAAACRQRQQPAACDRHARDSNHGVPPASFRLLSLGGPEGRLCLSAAESETAVMVTFRRDHRVLPSGYRRPAMLVSVSSALWRGKRRHKRARAPRRGVSGCGRVRCRRRGRTG